MQKRRVLLIVLLCVVWMGVPLAMVNAFPGVPYDGQANATGIDMDLVVPGASVVITVTSQTSDMAGDMNVPVLTNGRGDGLDVAVIVGSIPGADADIINVTTTKLYDGDPSLLTNADFVPLVNTPLVDTSVLSAATTSQATDTIARSTSDGLVNAVDIFVGGVDIVVVEAITNAATTETTVANALNNQAISLLTGVQITLPVVGGNVDVLSADLISSTATAVSDGTLPTADATSSEAFLNLMVGGNPVVVAPGFIVTVTGGIPVVDVARVTIISTSTTNQTATSSAAESIPILIEVLAGNLAGTQIQLARSYVESNVSNNSATGPTAISLVVMNASWQNVPAWTVILLIFLGLATAVVSYQAWIKNG